MWMMTEIFIDFFIMLLVFSTKNSEEFENIRTKKRKIILVIVGLILMVTFIIYCLIKESISDLFIYSFIHSSNTDPEQENYIMYCHRSLLYALIGCIFRSFNLACIITISIAIYTKQKKFHILDTLYISQDNIYHLWIYNSFIISYIGLMSDPSC